MEPPPLLIDYRHLISKLSIGFALLAALFWLAASLVKTPVKLRHLFHLGLDGEFAGDMPELAKAVAKQSRLNGLAAGLTCCAILFQALSEWIGVRYD